MARDCAGGSRSSAVIDLEDVEPDSDAVGTKGRTLARLRDAGFEVPPTYCVSTDVFEAVVDEAAIRQAITELDDIDPEDRDRIAAQSATVRSMIRDRTLPERVQRNVTDAVDTFDADTFAVRSSAVDEDTEVATYAGQYESKLSIPRSDVLDAVRSCLAGAFTERAVTYRSKNGRANAAASMAVLVQPMVDADVTGVAASVDPISENRRVALVEAADGSRPSIVDGGGPLDRVLVHRESGEIRRPERDRPPRRADFEDERASSVESESARTRRTLSDEECRGVTAVADRLEQLLGGPQYVEWALLEDRLVVLQSRPIPTLFPLPDPAPEDSGLHVYVHVGHQQMVPRALPPLVRDVWHSFFENAARRFRPPGSTGAITVEAGGRVFVDVTPFLRVAPVPERVADRLGKISEPAAELLHRLLRERRDDLRLDGRTRGILKVVRAAWNARGFTRRTLRGIIVQTIRAGVGPPSADHEWAWARAWGRELAAPVRTQKEVEERVRSVFEDTDFATVMAGALPRLARTQVGLLAKRLLSTLVPDAEDEVAAIQQGAESPVVRRLDERLDELASVMADRDVQDSGSSTPSLDELETTADGGAIADRLDALLTEFGHRGAAELDLSEPRWNDAPERVLRMAQRRIESGTAPEEGSYAERRHDRAEMANRHLRSRCSDRSWPWRGILRPLVSHTVTVYRANTTLREVPKHGFAHLMDAMHDALADAGRTLAASDVLGRSSDVWFLRRDELLDALTGVDPTVPDVESRRMDYDVVDRMDPPPIVTSEGEVPSRTSNPGHRPNALGEPTSDDRSDRTLVGTPVSTGTVEGEAVVLTDARSTPVESGTILVVSAIDPSVLSLIPRVAGIVSEIGGQTTHGSLVAREFGSPAVTSVQEATAVIDSGDRIRVDGSRGTVERGVDRES